MWRSSWCPWSQALYRHEVEDRKSIVEMKPQTVEVARRLMRLWPKGGNPYALTVVKLMLERGAGPVWA